jgi:hypothetical protein
MSTLPDEDGLNWFEAALGWLLPGYGLIRLGHRRRGAWAMSAVLGLFASGLVIGGLDSVDRREDGLWFVMQAGAGPVAFAADPGTPPASPDTPQGPAGTAFTAGPSHNWDPYGHPAPSPHPVV